LYLCSLIASHSTHSPTQPTRSLFTQYVRKIQDRWIPELFWHNLLSRSFVVSPCRSWQVLARFWSRLPSKYEYKSIVRVSMSTLYCVRQYGVLQLVSFDCVRYGEVLVLLHILEYSILESMEYSTAVTSACSYDCVFVAYFSTVFGFQINSNQNLRFQWYSASFCRGNSTSGIIRPTYAPQYCHGCKYKKE
jgi:hypothetical protein